MFLLLQVGRENMFLESKIPSCCVMDTLGSITSLYQVIQEYYILSGTRFARNSISCRITWYSWKNRQAMAHCVSFALPGWFIRPLWLHQFDAFDTPQSCFHLMFLRYWCYVNWYYLCQHGTIAYCQLYGCCVLSLNVSQNPFLGSYVIAPEHQSFFPCQSLLPVCSLKCFLGFSGVCACFVCLDCVHLSTPATYGREGNGLRAAHEGR